jgi:hypothetical protein
VTQTATPVVRDPNDSSCSPHKSVIAGHPSGYFPMYVTVLVSMVKAGRIVAPKDLDNARNAKRKNTFLVARELHERALAGSESPVSCDGALSCCRRMGHTLVAYTCSIIPVWRNLWRESTAVKHSAECGVIKLGIKPRCGRSAPSHDQFLGNPPKNRAAHDCRATTFRDNV